MRARDTSPNAAAIQDRVHDALGPNGRFELALTMSRLAREFAKAAVRAEHPTFSDAEVTRELIYQLYPQIRRKIDDGG
jgi:hypothetical protein